MSDPIIRAERLGRDFKTVTALDELTLEVPPGIVFGFLGPNGAGKTTTIRLLLGLLEPTRGRAEVLGLDVGDQSGALLEQSGLYERRRGNLAALAAREGVTLFLLPMLPATLKAKLFAVVARVNVTAAVLAVTILLIATDVFILLAADARFRRNRLILD